MILFAWSEQTWQTIITGAFGVVIVWMQLRASGRVSEVKSDLAKTQAVAEATHTLCNSAMGAQKRLLAATAQALAIENPTEVNITAARVASDDLAAHEARQRTVDRMTKGAP